MPVAFSLRKSHLGRCLLAVFLFAVGCKPTPPIPVVKDPEGRVVPPPPTPDEDEENAAKVLADEARRLDEAGQAEAALKVRDQLLALYPATASAAVTFERRAQAAIDTGDTQGAIGWYEKLIFYRPQFERINKAREAYANLLVDVGRLTDAANMFFALFENSRDREAQARLGFPLAKVLRETGEARRALEMYGKLRSLGNLPEASRLRAEALALEIAAQDLSFGDALDFWDDVKGDGTWTFAHPLLAFRLAKIHYHTRDYKAAETMLTMVGTRYAQSEFGPPARDLLQRLRDRFRVDPRAVGVLLPLSGKYRQFGERSLKALQLVFGAGSPYRLVVKDTAGDPTQASQGVEELVHQDHVATIIGPLFSKTALSAARKAEELSVPLIALSIRKDLPKVGPYVFRSALTVEAQARHLAQVAFENLGLSRFALLYPRSQYGLRFIDAFWNEVDRRQGEIRAAESYEPDETTFQIPIRRLVGRHYLLSRGEYKNKLKELKAEKLPPHRFRAALEKFEKGLPPIVDFDAIIIPESGRRIGLLAPALAFEDIVLTRDPEELETIKKALGYEDVNPVTLLGGSSWNNPEVVTDCGRHCKNAVFVDAYFPDHPSPKVRDFVASFREAVGSDPNLTDAQAFDTAGMIQWLLETSKPQTRDQFRQALLAMQGYTGVTGKMRFDTEGESQKELFVLTVREESIRLWEGPTQTPQG